MSMDGRASAMRDAAANGTAEPVPVHSDWGDAGYFRGRSRVTNLLRLVWQLFSPPRGHRIRITKPGLLLILVSFGIGTAAFNTSQNILYVALSLMLSTLLLSGLLSWMNFKGLSWRLASDSHFRVGRESAVRVEIRNAKRFLPSYSLRFDLESVPSGRRAALWMERRIDGGTTRIVEWWMRPQRRGVETVRMEGVVSQFPFGFLRKTILKSCSCDVIVWPERVEYEFAPAARGRALPAAGRMRSKGGGTELLRIRDYRPGDALRQLHWKASARRGQLLVRENAEERDQSFALHIDSSADLWREDAVFERMCSFAASLAEDLFMRGRLAEVTIDGGTALPVRIMADLERVLDHLSRVQRGGGDSALPARPAAASRWPIIRFAPAGANRVSCEVEGVHAGFA